MIIKGYFAEFLGVKGGCMNRDKKIDSIKGFAILLVVLGHAIQTNVQQFDDNLLFRIIYSFHMPLFMFLSGYIFKNKVPLPTLVKNKFIHLVVPFLSWYLLRCFLTNNGNFYEYMYRLFISVDYGLWFLWVLFLNFCYLGLVLKLKNDLLIIPAIIFLRFIPIDILGIGLMKWHFPFFAFGHLVGKYKKIPIQIGLLFPLLTLTWYRIDNPAFWPYVSSFFVDHNLRGLGLMRLVYSYLVPFTGIAFTFLIFRPVRWLSWLGTVTIDIYVSHQMFLRYSLGEGWVRIFSTFISALVISLALSILIIRRLDTLSILFLGRSRNQGISNESRSFGVS